MSKKANYSYIGISFIILLFGILFIPKIINRISNKEIVDQDRHNLERLGNKSSSDLVTIGKVPNFNFLNQDSVAVSDRFFEGKVYVVEFFFTTCPSICPIMNQNMGVLEKQFLKEDDFGIASFTIDPVVDTPEVLKAYATLYEMTHPNWQLLTGEKEAIYKLANEGFNLYVGEAPEVDGGFEHSGYFALIDKQGNIRSRIDDNGNPIIYYDGLEENQINWIKEDIKLLIKE